MLFRSSINGPYERERGNLNGFRELPFHLEKLPFESKPKVAEDNPEGVGQELLYHKDILADSQPDDSTGDPSLYTTPREQDNLDSLKELPYNEDFFPGSIPCPLESKDMPFRFLE